MNDSTLNSSEFHAQKDPVFSALTHELRNILTMTSCSLNVVELQHPEVKNFSHWKEIQEDFLSMRELLKQFSAYNNCGNISPVLQPLLPLIRQVQASAQAWLDARQQTLSVRAEKSLPPLFLDSIKIRELLINLLKNASEASPSGSPIRIDVRRKQDWVLMSITDQGCGIPPEQAEKIFEVFHTTKPEGSGLGLPLARRIARAHGGELSFRSIPGAETCFTVSFPVCGKKEPRKENR